MKKYLIIAFCLSLVLLFSCTNVEEAKTAELSELQVAACTTAHDAKTCTTRLLEVGIVMPEECCLQLSKCC